ncbi:MAG: hypothetical protein JNL10_14960 [Verrucomicrobiales bacterium]|nr:hypothetical protein [Verrucomicrobiales bacterium]
MDSITPTELHRRLGTPEAPRLLDVREPGEHALGALPESRLIPLGELPERAGELEDWQDSDVVVYCHHGIRSARAGAFLESLGFRRIFNLSGGVDRWATEVDPRFPRY